MSRRLSALCLLLSLRFAIAQFPSTEINYRHSRWLEVAYIQPIRLYFLTFWAFHLSIG